ncbi:MAG: protein-methionine-sulfoxide reductase catalytic subunit MsrP [Caldilineaceae bacterium]|nr:protein-methionine-sulfoxide reductase catalytic subunit MsrP [Caldilineaceae bacterium]
MVKIPSSEITPEHLYLSRRAFMVGAGSLSAAALIAAGCASPSLPGAPAAAAGAEAESNAASAAPRITFSELPEALSYDEPFATSDTDDLGDALNSYDEITNYNNYYEFSTDKQEVAVLSTNFNTLPWQVEVTGLCNKPTTFDIEDVVKRFTQEERIYRLRCVEAWSMVIPWVGFPVGELLRAVEPKAEAQFVKFTTIVRPEEMPNQRRAVLDWPYVEGLRMDEAMNDLAIFATGMYGKPLVVANGAPFRLVVPWKYGFKSIKGIVKIELTDTMPQSTWMLAAPREYGFYANVNPEVNHPRWSQASERRIGELGRRDTLPFNGYGEEVAHLYAGMDLRANF